MQAKPQDVAVATGGPARSVRTAPGQDRWVVPGVRAGGGCRAAGGEGMLQRASRPRQRRRRGAARGPASGTAPFLPRTARCPHPSVTDSVPLSPCFSPPRPAQELREDGKGVGRFGKDGAIRTGGKWATRVG